MTANCTIVHTSLDTWLYGNICISGIKQGFRWLTRSLWPPCIYHNKQHVHYTHCDIQTLIVAWLQMRLTSSSVLLNGAISSGNVYVPYQSSQVRLLSFYYISPLIISRQVICNVPLHLSCFVNEYMNYHLVCLIVALHECVCMWVFRKYI